MLPRDAMATRFMRWCKWDQSQHQLAISRLSINNYRRRSTLFTVNPFTIVILCTLFIYLAVTTYVMVNIIKNFESAPDTNARSLHRQNPFFRGINTTTTTAHQHLTVSLKSLSITFQQNIFSSNRAILYPPIRMRDERDRHPNYNHLSFDSLDEEDFVRKILYTDEGAYIEAIEGESTDDYYADSIPVGDGDDTKDCQPVPWKTLQLPVCNTIHENNFELKSDQYLGHGYYRDAWLLQDPSIIHVGHIDDKDFVLKQMRLPSDDDDTDHLPNPGSFRKIQREAIIMERLTSSSYIVNIYGHCGLSVLAETSEDNVVTTIIPESEHVVQTNSTHFQSINNLNSIEKLMMAIEMSKAIADIHGFSGGRIVHGDIHPVQWLRAKDSGTLKLNDFNNAEILAVNRRRTRNDNVTYCKSNRGDWSGSFRSPEELLGKPVDEKIDVYSMGNIIYTLLTGQLPFSNIEDSGEVSRRITHNEPPHIDKMNFQDNNTFIEREMIDIMERMWNHYPQDRPSIFEVLDFLLNIQSNISVNNTSLLVP